MAFTIAENGAVLLTDCCARCDSCGHVRGATQFTGPNGYVVICSACQKLFREIADSKAAALLEILPIG